MLICMSPSLASAAVASLTIPAGGGVGAGLGASNQGKMGSQFLIGWADRHLDFQSFRLLTDGC